MKAIFYYTFLFVIFMQTLSCSYAQKKEEKNIAIDSTQLIGSWKLVKTIGKNLFQFQRVDENSSDIDIVFNQNGSISQRQRSDFWGLPQVIGGTWILGKDMKLQLLYGNGINRKIDDSFLIKKITTSSLEIKLLDRKVLKTDCG